MPFSFFKGNAKPYLIAHRGASGYAPENTLAAFKLAVDMGARFIELDVHQTKDGRIIVTHDDSLHVNRGRRRPISEFTLADVAEVKAPNKFDTRYSNEPIPTLEEVLALVARRAVINVEIKGMVDAYPGIEEKVLDILEHRGYNGMFFISSFNPDCLTKVRHSSPTAPLCMILGSKRFSEVEGMLKALRCEALALSAKSAVPKTINKARQRGYQVLIYTVNSKKIWDKFAKMRLDAIYTDFPDLLGMEEYQEPSVGLTSGE